MRNGGKTGVKPFCTMWFRANASRAWSSRTRSPSRYTNPAPAIFRARSKSASRSVSRSSPWGRSSKSVVRGSPHRATSTFSESSFPIGTLSWSKFGSRRRASRTWAASVSIWRSRASIFFGNEAASLRSLSVLLPAFFAAAISFVISFRRRLSRSPSARAFRHSLSQRITSSRSFSFSGACRFARSFRMTSGCSRTSRMSSKSRHDREEPICRLFGRGTESSDLRAGRRPRSPELVEEFADFTTAGLHRELHEAKVPFGGQDAGQGESVSEELDDHAPAAGLDQDVVRLGKVEARRDFRRGGKGERRHRRRRHGGWAAEGRDDREAAAVSDDRGADTTDFICEGLEGLHERPVQGATVGIHRRIDNQGFRFLKPGHLLSLHGDRVLSGAHKGLRKLRLTKAAALPSRAR